MPIWIEWLANFSSAVQQHTRQNDSYTETYKTTHLGPVCKHVC